MSALDPQVSGKVAVITGGGTGIGAATAMLLAEHGADVVVAGRTAESLDRTVEMVTGKTGRKALAVVTDVRDAEQVRALIQTTVARFGALDILVNNAGGTYLRPMDTLSMADWHNSIALNLDSVFSAMSYAIPHLEAAGHGTVVNVSSSAASTGIRGGSAYSAAKAAVEMLTKVAAAELGPRNIRVNCVAPGMVRSDGAERSWARANLDISSSEQRIPLRRVGEPIDIARAILFLASDASAFMTGEIVHVDGGPQMEG